jgi:hypothetical protein
MNNQSFFLAPFPSARPLPSVTMEGTIARHADTLAIRYTLLGRLTEVVIPAWAALPDRQGGLWKDTCFEFFLAVKGVPQYWEFNLSPAGHWNVYRFTSHREGMTEEPAFTALPFTVKTQRHALTLALELDLGTIVPADLALEVAISALLRHTDGSMTHWALIHRGPEPDFHQRDSFIIAL